MTATYEAREALAEVALEAARAAGALLLQGFRSRPAAERKGRVDLVTEFDRASERLVRARLEAGSAVPVVGEEEGGARPETGATWFVDPLDGTTNFVHGHPYFAVSIGLVEDSVPVVGVVVAPALGLEYVGVTEGGLDGRTVARGARRRATRGAAPCAVSDVDALVDALLATGFPYDIATSPDDNLDAFAAMMKKCQGIRRCGSAALDLCHVADGTYDGYWERKLKPWDLAGGAAVVLAAGGALTSDEGARPDVSAGHVVATNGRLHDALLAELAPLRPRARRG